MSSLLLYSGLYYKFLGAETEGNRICNIISQRYREKLFPFSSYKKAVKPSPDSASSSLFAQQPATYAPVSFLEANSHSCMLSNK